ncbi:MAG: hypothetical protein IPJ07_24175 [Acidobacteria bacterium]|nr:hypothetical protein [Acidobacteriota bacterium]
MYKDYAKVEQHTRKAVELDPRFARAWQTLALVEEVRGNNANEHSYLKKAAEAAPDNPAYAFYYANSLKRKNKSLWRKSFTGCRQTLSKARTRRAIALLARLQ